MSKLQAVVATEDRKLPQQIGEAVQAALPPGTPEVVVQMAAGLIASLGTYAELCTMGIDPLTEHVVDSIIHNYTLGLRAVAEHCGIDMVVLNKAFEAGAAVIYAGIQERKAAALAQMETNPTIN